MERIVLEVDDSVAKNWRNTTPEIKSLIERHIADELGGLLLKTKNSNFDMLLKKAGEEAETNRLTDTLLKELLEDEE